MKEKYIGLKRAQQERSTAWRQEIEVITQELLEKQQLEDQMRLMKQEQSRLQQELVKAAEREVAQSRELIQAQTELKQVRDSSKHDEARSRAPGQEAPGATAGRTLQLEEQSRLQQDLVKAAEREVAQSREIIRLKAELEKARTGVEPEDMPPEEMQKLNVGLGQQLVAVEQELKEQVRKSSRLLEHFLKSIQRPLEVLRRFGWHLAASSALHNSLQPPEKFQPNVHDLERSLSQVGKLLSFTAQMVEAREQSRINAGYAH